MRTREMQENHSEHEAIDPMEEEITQGALRVKTDDGVVECPLKHTDVKAKISGFIAYVTVTQTFDNPYDEKIEAVYTFPLPHTAAVDDMTMVIGERKIVGLIKRRNEAREIYEEAIERGATASLLEQERPNIFTQSVGNIKPHQEIQIEISYVDVLNYDMGTYEFHFPMVVGPRYIPGAPISKQPVPPEELKGKVGEGKAPPVGTDPSGTGWSSDTIRVPDASRITPPVLKPGYRTGHDISLSVSLDAGVPVQDINIVNHKAELERIGRSGATVAISPADSIPNKDFVMKYAVVGEKPEMAVLAHSKGPNDGYFMLMIQPKLDPELEKAPPRELVFLIDLSGSMSGEPLDKVKEAMGHFLRLCKPNDTVQVITFDNRASKLFKRPVPATEENVKYALNFTEDMYGRGGTEMLKGIRMVLKEPVDPERVRIVVMFTDGYIGNEDEIIAEVGKRAGDDIRFWVIGVGSSPNRLLIDGVAKQGGGMSGVIEHNSDPKPLVTEVVERIHRAQLAKIQIDWNQLPVYETYPRRIPELWVGRPVILFGRYKDGGSTQIELSGFAEGEPITYALDVTLPHEHPEHTVLPKVWARQKIEDISAQMFYADTYEVIEEITELALTYRLMSQYTSFVAVDENAIELDQPKPPRRVVIPVPLPEGVRFDGIFDEVDQSLLEKNVRRSVEEDMEATIVTSPSPSSPPGFTMNEVDDVEEPLDSVDVPEFPRMKRVRESLPRVSESHRYELRPLSYQRRSDLVLREDLVPNWFSLPDTAEAAHNVFAEAQDLQKAGKLEAARLRYQYALGLQGDGSDESVVVLALEAIESLTTEIGKKRAASHPRLNQTLDTVIWNQPVDEAIRGVVEAGGFRLDLVRGSLEDAGELLNLPELRVTYLDLRHATVTQGLDWLLAPYHLTWQMKDADTITVGTTRRLPMPSAWGYAVADLVVPLEQEIGKGTLEEGGLNAMTALLEGVRTVIAQKEDSVLTPGSVVSIGSGRLLVYGEPSVHQKVQVFLNALRDSQIDVVEVTGRSLSSEACASLTALQKLTVARWNQYAGVRKKVMKKQVRQRVTTNLKTAPWQLLAEAIRGGVDLEALATLQIAWDNPHIKKADSERVMRSAWCISAAAQAVPTNTELVALSEKVLSTVRDIKIRKPRHGDPSEYLATLYAGLVSQNCVSASSHSSAGDALSSQVDDVMKLLAEVRKNDELWTTRIIAEALRSRSVNKERRLLTAISAHEIRGDDHVLLTSLIAKRRGGQLWDTFRQEMPDIVGQQPLNGHVVVALNRLEESELTFLPE